MTLGVTTPTPAAARSRRSVVWIVDDSPLETELARRLLEPHHDLEVFYDGVMVIERVAQGGAPDLLVLDWHMPSMSGLEVCQFLRKTHDQSSLPILILTATGERDDLIEGLVAGANDFVTKAFEPSELVARVATLVRTKRLHESVKQAELASRQAQQVAEQANRAKDIFLATVSHELRTPLNALLGWARLLNQGDVAPELLKRGLEVIERNAKIQVQLIEDILDISRVVSGKLHLESGPLDLKKLVQAALDALMPAATAKHLRVEATLAAGCRTIGDGDRLQQAVSNLLSNAIKFTKAGGHVKVTLERAARGFEICVRDSGIGISAEFLPQVFDRFQQQDLAATRHHAGLGLGLTLVKSIVEAHGGHVRAESAGENTGATFTLTLPDAEIVQAGRVTEPPASSRRLSSTAAAGALVNVDVLIVEDDADANELLAVVLEREGARVRQAFSVREALTLFEERRPAVLISDVGLPGADGYELMRSIRAQERGNPIPAVALTAYAQRNDHRRALEAGFHVHVAKPVEPQHLVAVVTGLLARRQ